MTDFDKQPDESASDAGSDAGSDAASDGGSDAGSATGSGAPQPPFPLPPGYPGGGYYPPPPPPRSPTSIAMWAHLGLVITLAVGSSVCCLGPMLCWIVPLVIRNDERNRHDPFIRHHATQALNHAITQAIALTVGMILGTVTYLGVIFTLVSHSDGDMPSGLPALPVTTGVLFAALVVYCIAGFVFAVIGTTKANSGQWWSYPKPFAIRFVKG